MDASESKERLLSGYQDEERLQPCGPASSTAKSLRSNLAWVLLLLSLSLNALFVIKWQHVEHIAERAKTPFARLSYNTLTTYHNDTEYMSSNETHASQMWTDIDTSPLEVALTDEYAAEHGLGRSILRFPWDPSKGIYFLKVYHHLHCLKVIRHAYVDFVEGNERTISPHHVYHCFDALRQDLMCNADDTPMAMHDFPNKIGNGQERMCRNFDDLISWTREPERNPCYRRFTDYGVVEHRLEQYAYCSDDSPYRDVQNAYFEKWGHKDPDARLPWNET